MKRILFGLLILVAVCAVSFSHGSAAWFSDEEISIENTLAAGEWDYAPTVSIISPTNGATVSGTVTIEAIATDDFMVEKVTFYYDSAYLIGVVTEPPFSVTWDSTSVSISNENYTLTAIATDAAFQTASDSIVVTVEKLK